ncbi:MAG: chemotaxis protein CheA [Paracoccus sp. (in: a-proteobacteria)]|nr:chemotaxis protein CheA [Paracoccus sp. (in: a-proteobacteria)]
MTQDPMAEIRASFFLECDELLESLQDALGVLDSGDYDSETINIVFRAVHSIKGGAGAFGLDALVNFAHRYETVMDELRAGRMELTADATRLFFQAADMLQDHVAAARDGGDVPAGSEQTLHALEALLGEDHFAEEEAVEFAPMVLDFGFGAEDAPAEDAGPTEAGWSIRFTPHRDLYLSGNEPLLILRSLAQLGQAQIECHIPDDLPPPNEDNAETPLLSWTIRLTGDADEDDVRLAFDFVADVCDLDITPIIADEIEDPAPAPLEPAPAPVAVTEPDTAPAAPPMRADAASAGAKPASEPPSATVRVDLEKIDRLVNLVGELVINQAMLSQSVEKAGLGSHGAVISGLEAFMMLTRDIQDSVMMIRAQPVKPLFQRMARIVRETSASVGKEVRLRTEGEATEIDKTVIERLAEPLTHMIRNSVDHGLELPEKRLAAGKPPEGVITLSASHRAGRILIEIEDDGAGINRPKVRDIAQQKGLIAPDAQLSDSDIDNLIFLPGFSTATEVSALSGRGVGMDVVKSAIISLGGRVSIASTPGSGTKFSISLPLTLAVLDGMVVRAAGQTLVVPLSAIIETARIDSQQIETLSGNDAIMPFRGEFVPIFDLGHQLGFREPGEHCSAGIVLLTTQENGRRAALIVDSIMEQRQVVIKGLSQSYGDIPGVAAATILGDGQIALILDPADLGQHGRAQSTSNDRRMAG